MKLNKLYNTYQEYKNITALSLQSYSLLYNNIICSLIELTRQNIYIIYNVHVRLMLDMWFSHLALRIPPLIFGTMDKIFRDQHFR